METKKKSVSQLLKEMRTHSVVVQKNSYTQMLIDIVLELCPSIEELGLPESFFNMGEDEQYKYIRDIIRDNIDPGYTKDFIAVEHKRRVKNRLEGKTRIDLG